MPIMGKRLFVLSHRPLPSFLERTNESAGPHPMLCRPRGGRLKNEIVSRPASLWIEPLGQFLRQQPCRALASRCGAMGCTAHITYVHTGGMCEG